MVKSSISARGESGTKAGDAEGTSAGRPSRRKESEPITPEVRLRILQQAVYDLSQAGVKVGVSPLHMNGQKCACIIIEGADVDSIGNLVLAAKKGG